MGKGKAKGGAKGEAMGGGWPIPGFGEALEQALAPVMDQEIEQSLEDLALNIGKKILKAAQKYAKDERSTQRGTCSLSQVVITEYVETAMGAITSAFYDRPYINEVNLVPPLLSALEYSSFGMKIFNRTVAPSLERYVEQAMVLYREEERITKQMWETMEQTGIEGKMKKKAYDKLMEAYGDAHLKATYGTCVAETPEIGMLQDFVKGWMLEFVKRSHDVLTWGIASEGQEKAEKDEQILFVTVLFQNLCDPKNVCLPNELVCLVPVPPAHPWSFVGETAETVFEEAESARMEEKGGGKGKGKWGNDWMMDPWMMMKGKMMKGKGGPYGKGW